MTLFAGNHISTNSPMYLTCPAGKTNKNVCRGNHSKSWGEDRGKICTCIMLPFAYLFPECKMLSYMIPKYSDVPHISGYLYKF